MPTVSGVWKWNDNLNSALSGISAKTETTFVSNGNTYYGMQIQPSGRNVKISYATAYDTAWTDVFNGSWTNDAYATVDFGNIAVEMEQNFYTSFTKAATQQSTPTTVKAVSSANLAEFKAKCDETYAKIGEGGGAEVVDLGSLSLGANTITSEIYQAAMKDSCIAAKATIMSTPMYIPKYASTGSMALFVFSSNQDGVFNTITIQVESTNASVDMQNLTIPTPTPSDNGKVLGVTNGAYALQEASGGGGTKWYQHSISDGAGGYLGFISTSDMDCSGSVVINDFNAMPKVAQQCYSPDSSGAPNTTVNVFHIEAKSQYEITVYYFSGTTIKSFGFPLATDTVTPL